MGVSVAGALSKNVLVKNELTHYFLLVTLVVGGTLVYNAPGDYLRGLFMENWGK